MMKRFFNILSVAALMLLAVSCTQEKSAERLVLSVSSYTFGYDGSDSLVVEVAGGEGVLKAETESDFILISEPEGNKVTIRVKGNEEPVYRNGKVVFTCGAESAELAVEQEPLRFVGPFLEIPPQSMGTISSDGRYMAYVYNRWTGPIAGVTWEATAYLVDTQTGEVTDLNMPEYPANGPADPQFYNRVRALSDDASVIVYEHSMSTVQAVVVNGEVVEPALPDGYFAPSVSQVSTDGSVWVGWCNKMIPTIGLPYYVPTKWINGEPHILDFPYPYIDIFGDTRYEGCMARGCSTDGSVCYGSEWSCLGLVYWRDGVMYPIGPDNAVVNGKEDYEMIQTESQNMCMSPNGRYIACKLNTFVPVLVDTETGNFKVMESAPGYLATAVTDDGLVFGCQYGMSGSCVLDFEKDEIIPIDQWFEEKYGIVMGDRNVVTRVSRDGKVFFGDHLYPVEGALCPQWFVRVSK